jgi:hypothetical protein
MAKAKTLEELNVQVAQLAEQYKAANQELDDALKAMGSDQESRDRVVAATAKKQKLWTAYSKAKKQQVKLRSQQTSQ